MIATRGGVARLWLSLDRTQDREAADAALLAPDELVQGTLLRDPEARRRFVRRRALLRRVLGHVLGLPPGALRFERGPRGKPRLAPALAGDLRFSASSTGARLLLAVGRGWEVGTDLVSLGCPPPPRDAWPLVFGREAADRLSRVPARRRGREADRRPPDDDR